MVPVDILDTRHILVGSHFTDFAVDLQTILVLCEQCLPNTHSFTDESQSNVGNAVFPRCTLSPLVYISRLFIPKYIDK